MTEKSIEKLIEQFTGFIEYLKLQGYNENTTQRLQQVLELSEKDGTIDDIKKIIEQHSDILPKRSLEILSKKYKEYLHEILKDEKKNREYKQLTNDLNENNYELLIQVLENGPDEKHTTIIKHFIRDIYNTETGYILSEEVLSICQTYPLLGEQILHLDIGRLTNTNKENILKSKNQIGLDRSESQVNRLEEKFTRWFQNKNKPISHYYNKEDIVSEIEDLRLLLKNFEDFGIKSHFPIELAVYGIRNILIEDYDFDIEGTLNKIGLEKKYFSENVIEIVYKNEAHTISYFYTGVVLAYILDLYNDSTFKDRFKKNKNDLLYHNDSLPSEAEIVFDAFTPEKKNDILKSGTYLLDGEYVGGLSPRELFSIFGANIPQNIREFWIESHYSEYGDNEDEKSAYLDLIRNVNQLRLLDWNNESFSALPQKFTKNAFNALSSHTDIEVFEKMIEALGLNSNNPLDQRIYSVLLEQRIYGYMEEWIRVDDEDGEYGLENSWYKEIKNHIFKFSDFIVNLGNLFTDFEKRTLSSFNEFTKSYNYWGGENGPKFFECVKISKEIADKFGNYSIDIYDMIKTSVGNIVGNIVGKMDDGDNIEKITILKDIIDLYGERMTLDSCIKEGLEQYYNDEDNIGYYQISSFDIHNLYKKIENGNPSLDLLSEFAQITPTDIKDEDSLSDEQIEKGMRFLVNHLTLDEHENKKYQNVDGDVNMISKFFEAISITSNIFDSGQYDNQVNKIIRASITRYDINDSHIHLIEKIINVSKKYGGLEELFIQVMQEIIGNYSGWTKESNFSGISKLKLIKKFPESTSVFSSQELINKVEEEIGTFFSRIDDEYLNAAKELAILFPNVDNTKAFHKGYGQICAEGDFSKLPDMLSYFPNVEFDSHSVPQEQIKKGYVSWVKENLSKDDGKFQALQDYIQTYNFVDFKQQFLESFTCFKITHPNPKHDANDILPKLAQFYEKFGNDIDISDILYDQIELFLVQGSSDLVDVIVKSFSTVQLDEDKIDEKKITANLSILLRGTDEDVIKAREFIRENKHVDISSTVRRSISDYIETRNFSKIKLIKELIGSKIDTKDLFMTYLGVDTDKINTNDMQILEVILDLGEKFAKKFYTLRDSEGEEKAKEFRESFRKQTASLTTSLPNTAFRNDPNYLDFVQYVYQKGNYGNYSSNLKLPDRIDHIQKYTYQNEGYNAVLDKNEGYILREGREENIDLLNSYSSRLDTMRSFLQKRGPNNKFAKDEFGSHIDALIAEHRHKNFDDIKTNTIEEKMLVLYLSKILDSNSSSNSVILDTVVLYKYIFEENLEDYIRRSADDIQQYFDKVSQHYSLLSELNTIYGENTKHILTHNIFEPLKKKSEFLSAIKERFLGEFSEGQYDLSQKQIGRLKSTLENKHIPEEKKSLALQKQMRVMTIANIPKDLQDVVYKQLDKKIFSQMKGSFQLRDINNFVKIMNKIRFGAMNSFEKKLEQYLMQDADILSKELSKYKELGSSTKRSITGFITKTKESSNARMVSHICLAGDLKMRNNERYFELVLREDATNKCAGMCMLMHVQSSDGKDLLWFGPNPSENILTKVSTKKLYRYILKTVIDFAKENGFEGVVVPAEPGLISGHCTNRHELVPIIKDSVIKKNGKRKKVSYDKSYTVGHYGGSPYSYASGAYIWEK